MVASMVDGKVRCDINGLATLVGAYCGSVADGRTLER